MLLADTPVITATQRALYNINNAHIINAEAEKIQSILGTLEDHKRPCGENEPTIDDLLKINKSVDKMLKKVIAEEIILQFKLEDAIELIDENHHC